MRCDIFAQCVLLFLQMSERKLAGFHGSLWLHTGAGVESGDVRPILAHVASEGG